MIPFHLNKIIHLIIQILLFRVFIKYLIHTLLFQLYYIMNFKVKEFILMILFHKLAIFFKLNLKIQLFK